MSTRPVGPSSIGQPQSTVRLRAVLLGSAADIGASLLAGGLLTYAMLERDASASGNAEQVTRLADDPWYGLASFLIGTAGTALGGFVAGVLARGSEIKNALVVGVVALVFTVLGVAMTPDLLTYWHVALSVVAALPSAWVGGRLAVRRAANAA